MAIGFQYCFWEAQCLILDAFFLFENLLTFRVLKFQGDFPWDGSLFYSLDCILNGLFNSRHSCPSTLGNFLNYFFDFSVSFWITCYSRCWTAWIDPLIFLSFLTPIFYLLFLSTVVWWLKAWILASDLLFSNPSFCY